MNPEEKDENKAPEPFYHQSENFSSAYFGEVPDHLMPQEKSKDKNLMANIISLVTDPRNREIRENALNMLRENDARPVLVKMLGLKEYKKYRTELARVCWETGLDFSSDLVFFCEMLAEPDIEMEPAIELVTILEEMQGPFSPEIVEKAVQILANIPQNSSVYPIIFPVYRKLKETEAQ